ncbi:MAG: peptidyl-prolyl cis-trans isomerase, partial [Paracoccaceae bacterium]|nr:peptidyl-prolyl cis-trans isomerase [Paracoccaceae bacterium]
PSRFRSAPLWEVSHILVACDPQDAAIRDAAKLKAQALAARLAKAPDAFARIARTESDCPSRAEGGALGQLGPGDTVPEFEAALRELAEGAVTAEPVLSRHGWHLIRLDAVAEGRELPYAAARPRLVAAMEKAAWAAAGRRLVGRLAATADLHGVDLAPVAAEG